MARDIPGPTVLAGGNSLITPALVGPSGGFTASIWVNPDSINGTRLIAAMYNSSTVNYFQLGNIATGVLFARIFSDGTDVQIGRKTAASAIANSVWQHVLFTWDGTTTSAGIKIYVDGTQVDNADDQAGIFTTVSADSVACRIGNQNSGSDISWDGKLAEFAAWSIALSAAEIGSLARGVSPQRIQPGSRAIGYFQCYETGTATEPDRSGLGNNATTADTLNVADHPPVAPMFGFDAGWRGMFTGQAVTKVSYQPWYQIAPMVAQ